MNFSEMLTLLEFYVDDVVDVSMAKTLFNQGKNRMAAAVGAELPDIEDTEPNDKFIFDARFHELPVLYAAAMVKAYDSSIREKDSFMADFEARVKDFVKGYNPPIQYLVGDNIQHFAVAAPGGDYQFKITDPSFNTYGSVDVYVNSAVVAHRRNGTEIYLDIPAPQGSIVTVEWDPNIYGEVTNWMKAW